MQRLQSRRDVIMTFGVCYNATKSILDELEMTEFSLESRLERERERERVATIQFRMSKCCGYCGCSFQIKTRSYATEVRNVIAAGFTEGRNLNRTN